MKLATNLWARSQLAPHSQSRNSGSSRSRMVPHSLSWAS